MKAKWEVMDRHYDKSGHLIRVRWYCNACPEYCMTELPPGKNIYHCELDINLAKKGIKNIDRS